MAGRISTTVNPATVDTLFAGPLTITTTAQSATTIAGATLITPADARWGWRGAGGFRTNGTTSPDNVLYQATSRYSNAWGNPSADALEFVHTGSVFELQFKYISTATMYRITVNGQRFTNTPQSVNGTTAGNRHVLKFDFGTRATRTIRITVSTMPIGGIYLASGDTFAAAPAPNTRMIFMGDSITGGSNMNTGLGAGTYPWRLGRYVGVDDPWNSGVGSTGYVVPGTSVTFASRVQADVIAWAPDVVVVFGGYNDALQPQATIRSAADSLYATLKAGLPGAEIYVVGCWSPVVNASTAITATDETLRAAAAAAGLPFISPITGRAYAGTGVQLADNGPWIASAADVTNYIGTDNTHPTDAGHAHVADVLRQGLVSAQLASNATVRLRVLRAGDSTGAVTRLRVTRAGDTTQTGVQANAGLDQSVRSTELVQLSALASSGAPTSFTWTQTAGPAVTLTPSAAVSQPAFKAPATDAGATLTFSLTVGAGGSTSTAATTNVAVSPHVEWVYLGGVMTPVITEAQLTLPPTPVSPVDVAVLSDDPVAYFPLDATGTTLDANGGPLVATPHGIVRAATMPNGDPAVAFDGASSYFEVPDHPSISAATTGALTVEAWVRPDVLDFPTAEGATTAPYVYFAGKGTTGQHECAARIYSAHADDGTTASSSPGRVMGFVFNLSGGIAPGVDWQGGVANTDGGTPPALTAGAWFHYALVVDTVNLDSNGDGSLKLYRNGVLVDHIATTGIALGNGAAPLRFGTRDLNSFFQGAIGKVAVYDKALPAARLLAHVRAMTGTFPA
jgi:lysophospholipase L1-like esterase